MKLYAFFLCFDCKEPYFYGEKQCGDNAEEHISAESRICQKCEEKKEKERRERIEKLAKENDQKFAAFAKANNTKPCPECQRETWKNGGCPHITCPCGAHWCWICGKNSDDERPKFDGNNVYAHIGRKHPGR